MPVTITSVSPEGFVTWTNVPTNATFTVQTATILGGESNWVDWVQVPVSNATKIHRAFDPNPPAEMAFIPAGSFTMGNCMATNEGSGAELPLHTVYVSAFYMEKYEVTKALWDDVYQWATNHGYGFAYLGSGKATNHPVHSVSWYDVVKWTNARSEKQGLTPCYYTDAGQGTIYKTGTINISNSCVNWVTSGYRLPTEAEWEKAARGGASGHRFPWVDTENITHSRANYNSSASLVYDTSSTRGFHPTFATNGWAYTSPVGYFAPNGYGLYDMAGNVCERCWDSYDATWYGNPGATQDDPRGPGGTPSLRVIRGGVWDNYADDSRCAGRDYGLPSTVSADYVGFRCVRSY